MKSDRLLRLVALFKLAKALLLLVLGFGALRLVDPRFLGAFERWVETVASNSDRTLAQRVIVWVSGVAPSRLHALGVVAFLYAGLFAIEGIGLWLAKRWAEYLTVIATSSLIPFEVFELVRRLTLPRVSALTLNLAVVAYLIHQLRRPSTTVVAL